MKSFLVKPAPHLKGKISLSGDKSIAHRSLIISAIAKGVTRIRNFPFNQDCLSTLRAIQALGVSVNRRLRWHNRNIVSEVEVTGRGLFGLRCPTGSIFAGESGTTFRFLVGVLAGQGFESNLTAGKSLSLRPMSRVNIPLRMMGAQIKAKLRPQNAKIEEYPPLRIRRGDLQGITYKMPIGSAQVKSAILLAGLYASGETIVLDTFRTRDHTERTLKLFHAKVKVVRNKIVIKGNHELISPGLIYVPGDISSASFFIVPALILPDSEVVIKDICLNPSRLGIINVLKRMGGDLRLKSRHLPGQGFEPLGDILVRTSRLTGTLVRKREIPFLIDELPILMVTACFARGKTIFEGVGELRVKETDRIRSMCVNLTKMAGKVRVQKRADSENVIIEGTKGLKGKSVRSFGDHRTAMSMVIAGLAAEGDTEIDDISCIDKSFPDFLDKLTPLLK